MRYEAYDAVRHYEALTGIWQARGWLPPPADCLPPTGFVACRHPDSEPVAALFVYIVPHCVGWIDWGIADPRLDRSRRRSTMRWLFRRCELLARKAGARFLYSTSQSLAFRSLLLDCGMVVAEERTTTFCKALQGDTGGMTFIRDYDAPTTA